MPVADREVLCHRFNARLQEARDQGVELSDVSIGEDCLPTWSGWNWDPETESLNAVIQERLSAAAFSQNLSILLTKDIINKGIKRLNQAVASGINIHEISFGLDLLPQWPQLSTQAPSQSDRETPSQVQISDSGYFSRESSVISTAAISQSFSDLFSTTDDDLDIVDSGSLVREDVSEDVEIGNVREEPPTQSSNEEARDKMEVDCPDSSHISTDSEDSSDDDVDAEDTLPKTNIVHDVEQAGGAKGADLIDMEVYLADDSDVDDVPELELAVHREGYEHHFGTTGAMDVELPESMTCTGFIDPSDSEPEDVNDEGLTRDQEVLRQMGLRHGWVNRSMSKKSQAEHVERLVAASREKDGTTTGTTLQPSEQLGDFEEQEPVEYDSESDISEEGVTTGEEEDEEEEPADEDVLPETHEGA